MRLKEDSSSYNASHIIKRDFRHTPQPDYPVRSQSKKNRAHFCGGKVNKPHIWYRYFPYPRPPWYEPDDLDRYFGMSIYLKCRRCNKISFMRRKANDPTIPLRIPIWREGEWYHDLEVRLA